MSDRDELAARAMQGILSNPDRSITGSLLASDAYREADAMLAARGTPHRPKQPADVTDQMVEAVRRSLRNTEPNIDKVNLYVLIWKILSRPWEVK